MDRRSRFTIGQWFGVFIFVSSTTIPGMSLAGFQGGTGWPLLVWVPISFIGGLIGGALIAREHRLSGAVGGMIAGPLGLLAIYFFARDRTKMWRAEVVIVQLLASLPGFGAYFILKLISNAIFRPKPYDEGEAGR